jgi:hypothetical protein
MNIMYIYFLYTRTISRRIFVTETQVNFLRCKLNALKLDSYSQQNTEF